MFIEVSVSDIEHEFKTESFAALGFKFKVRNSGFNKELCSGYINSTIFNKQSTVICAVAFSYAVLPEAILSVVSAVAGFLVIVFIEVNFKCVVPFFGAGACNFGINVEICLDRKSVV